ncbi:c-type cytochrome [Kiloniella laminariae]|uniref:c-type cytochrome n=1 Tax=Kiloniella laminariae TaxID=454162 RepID=UPI00035DDA08|nr:c-type cytochrome [Kiloniella laminariae]
MMKQFNLSLATGMLAAVLVSSAAVADDPQNTPIPAFGSQCLSCHGEDGRPELADVPIIAGQQPIYLANALRHYKSGERTNGQALVMQEMVKNLSDEQIVALAQWFGAQQ